MFRSVFNTQRAPRISKNLLIHWPFGDQALFPKQLDELGQNGNELGDVFEAGWECGSDGGDVGETLVGDEDGGAGGGAFVAGAVEVPVIVELFIADLGRLVMEAV